MGIIRCSWADSSPLMQEYHDKEWGVPVYDDQKLFAKLVLDTMQAGLSWAIILNKRENFLKAYDNFDPIKMATYDQAKVDSLLADSGIVRNKLKVSSAIKNAQAYLKLTEKTGSFSDYLWSYVDNKPVVTKWKTVADVPATTEISDRLSKDLKKAGFSFVGSTVVYAFMQAVGMVNDHLEDCFKVKS